MTFAHRPGDPRSREVMLAHRRGRYFELHLECGHVEKRSFLCKPQRVICHKCPPAGGFGVRQFGPRP